MAGFWDALKAGASNFAHTNPQTGLGLSDNLSRLGAIFQDGAAGFQGRESDQVAQIDRSRARKTAMQDLNGLFAPRQQGYSGMSGPGMGGDPGPRQPAAPGRVPSLTDPVTQRTLAQAAQAGIDPSTYIELLKANKREFVNGMAVDPYSTPTGTRIAELDKGMTQDPSGNVQLLPGYADAARTSAGAVTGGQEGAKAQFDVIPVQLPDGSTIQMPRAQLLQLQQTGQFPQLGRSATPGAIVSQQEAARAPYDLQTRKGPSGEDITASRAEFLGQGPLMGQTPDDAVYKGKAATTAADRFQGLQQRGATAGDRISQFQRLDQMLAGVEGGKLAETGVEVASALNSLGFKVDPKLGNKQAAQALSAQMLLTSMGGSLGPGVSNADVSFMQRTIPGLGQSADGRRKMIQYGMNVAKRDQQVSEFARNWSGKYGRIDARDAQGRTFDDSLRVWAAKNPLFGKR